MFNNLAGDLTGEPDRRPPLVLLHGLTFDRTSWHPVLAELTALDPGSRARTRARVASSVARSAASSSSRTRFASTSRNAAVGATRRARWTTGSWFVPMAASSRASSLATPGRPQRRHPQRVTLLLARLAHRLGQVGLARPGQRKLGWQTQGRGRGGDHRGAGGGAPGGHDREHRGGLGPAARSSGAPASRSSCVQTRRPGWPAGGEPRSTSNPRRRASSAAASASAVFPDPGAPTKVSKPPAPPSARSSSRPASRSSRSRPTTPTPHLYPAPPTAFP